MPVSIADGVSAVIPSGGGGSSLPIQTGHNNEVLSTNGTTTFWTDYRDSDKASITTLSGSTKNLVCPSSVPAQMTMSPPVIGTDRMVLFYHKQGRNRTLSDFLVYVTTGGVVGTKARIGVYELTSGDLPATLIIDSGDITGLNTTGPKTTSNTSTFPTGEFLIGLAVNNTCSLRGVATTNCYNLSTDLTGYANCIPYIQLSGGWTSLPATITAADIQMYVGTTNAQVPFWRY